MSIPHLLLTGASTQVLDIEVRNVSAADVVADALTVASITVADDLTVVGDVKALNVIASDGALKVEATDDLGQSVALFTSPSYTWAAGLDSSNAGVWGVQNSTQVTGAMEIDLSNNITLDTAATLTTGHIDCTSINQTVITPSKFDLITMIGPTTGGLSFRPSDAGFTTTFSVPTPSAATTLTFPDAKKSTSSVVLTEGDVQTINGQKLFKVSIGVIDQTTDVGTRLVNFDSKSYSWSTGLGASNTYKITNNGLSQDVLVITGASGLATFAGALSTTSSTASTTSSTGALLVTGGAGIGGRINAGGAINSTSTLSGSNLSAQFIGLEVDANNRISIGNTNAVSGVGSRNMTIGQAAGNALLGSSDNLLIGYGTAPNLIAGNANLVIGSQAASLMLDASTYNTIIGTFASNEAVKMTECTLIGGNTHTTATDATHQIVIGHGATSVGDSSLTIGSETTMVVCETTSSCDLGSTTYKWKDLYLSGAGKIASTTNQLVLGSTNTTTITSPAPAAARVYTIPDVGTTNADFVMSELVQTINGAKTFSGITSMTSGTASTSTTTGAVVVTGGVGISGALFVSTTTPASISNTGVLSITNATDSSSTTTGATIITGGVGIAKSLFVSTTTPASISNTGVLSVTNATDSTTTTSGSTIITGGVGIAKSLFVSTTTPFSVSNTGITTVSNATAASNSTTAALVVTGGIATNNGIMLPTSGGTPTLLAAYEYLTGQTISCSGAWTAAHNVPYSLLRIGNCVTMSWEDSVFVCNSAATVTSGANTIPTRFRPRTNTNAQAFNFGQNNSANTTVMVSVSAAGVFAISNGAGGNFTSSNNAGAWSGSASWTC